MKADLDFQVYLPLSREELVAALALVDSQLSNAGLNLAATLRAQLEAKIRGFMQSPATSIAQKERDADAQALSFSSEVLGLQGDIKALQLEHDFILLLIGERCPVKSISGSPSTISAPASRPGSSLPPSPGVQIRSSG